MKISSHIAVVLRAIMLIVVIAVQIAVPVTGRPLVCGPECTGTDQTHRYDEAGTDQCCEGLPDGDDSSDHTQEKGIAGMEDMHTDKHTGRTAGCLPDGCPCCAPLMLPGILPLPQAASPPAMVYFPALLGDIITRSPLPPDHPPC